MSHDYFMKRRKTNRTHGDSRCLKQLLPTFGQQTSRPTVTHGAAWETDTYEELKEHNYSPLSREHSLNTDDAAVVHSQDPQALVHGRQQQHQWIHDRQTIYNVIQLFKTVA